MLGVILYWIGILLIFTALGYFIIGLMRKDFPKQRILTLLIAGIIVLVLRRYLF